MSGRREPPALGARAEVRGGRGWISSRFSSHHSGLASRFLARPSEGKPTPPKALPNACCPRSPLGVGRTDVALVLSIRVEKHDFSDRFGMLAVRMRHPNRILSTTVNNYRNSGSIKQVSLHPPTPFAKAKRTKLLQTHHQNHPISHNCIHSSPPATRPVSKSQREAPAPRPPGARPSTVGLRQRLSQRT